MKRWLAFPVIASIGLFTVGCDKKGEQTTTTETKKTETVDGKVTGEQKTTTETKTVPAPGTDK
ncbi:MAG TPA: hypothetical protein VGY55_20420 [Pirellulales bacterium]|jgi:hypothetical protein|nr:hypothetical protein [Pirellulales bacterium]